MISFSYYFYFKFQYNRNMFVALGFPLHTCDGHTFKVAAMLFASYC